MANATSKGFSLRCLHCGEPETLFVTLCDLTISCRECESEITREELRNQIDNAGRLLAWLDKASEVV